MQRISVYIPDETRKRIRSIAQAKDEDEAAVIRTALDAGLPIVQPENSSGKALQKLAKLAQDIPTSGTLPQDAIENMDYYAWGGKKRA